MIFVTVGNATQGFRRLLDAVESLSEKGLLGDVPIYVQSGNNTDFCPRFCTQQPFLTMDEFNRFLIDAELIVSHGGCGTLLQCVRLRKIPVVMPRRKKYREHINDHQLQLVEALAAEGAIVPAYEPGDLPQAILAARSRRIQPALMYPSRMIELVEQAIQELTVPK